MYGFSSKQSQHSTITLSLGQQSKASEIWSWTRYLSTYTKAGS
jgi:hypothetical protein